MDTDTMTYGPHAAQVVELLDRIANMTADEARRVSTMPLGVFVRTATEARIDAYQRADMDRVLERSDAFAAAIAAATNAVQEAASRYPVVDDSWEAAQSHVETWYAADAAATNAVYGLVLRDILDPADFETLTAPLAKALGVTL